MANDTQAVYEATYNAVRDELVKTNTLSVPMQAAAHEWLNHNREEIIYRIAEICGAEIKSFLDLNRQEIIEAIAARAEGGSRK